ncbi:MAG: hypothetical protein PHN51_10365 [Candidatus Nanopelagicales bacterium]|nr:hypothetical protein [Candidatus Nanopelagicales bacterium]
MDQHTLTAAVQSKVTHFQQTTQTNGDALFQQLVQDIQPKTIPEDVFVRYFLPSFLGGEQNPRWVAEWVSIAGTPSCPVAVVDVRGKELYRVPPLYLTEAVTAARVGPSFKQIAQTAELYSNSLAGNGGYLMDALSKKPMQINSDDFQRASQVWYSILARYNIVPPQAVGTQITPPPPASVSDMFEY